MEETGEPDKSQGPLQNRTCVHGATSQRCHSEDSWNKEGGSEVGITQYRISHGEILLFDEADRIKGDFQQKNKRKVGFQSWELKEEKPES